jgi:hypothetical protein
MHGADRDVVSVRAVLRGGPLDIPAGMRDRRVATDDDKVKIQWLGGYEHFERDLPIADQPITGQPVAGQPVAGQPVAGQPTAGQPAAPDETDPVVFRWTTRTRIAE